MPSSPIDPRIFRAYDIRGVAEEQITEDACMRIAHAFGTLLREQSGKAQPVVCVGRDARTHGPAFQEAVNRGLVHAGCRVLDIGMQPSPVHYFAICHAHADGGIQVTASHNPAQDNGLKLSLAHAHAFAGEDLQQLRRRTEEGPLLTGEGAMESYDAATPYLSLLAQHFPQAAQGMHIAVDSGNGVAGPLYCQALRAAGATITELYTEPDGTFPHHPADPSKYETLRDLQEAVRANKIDCGLAFDGDGDRIGMVDETGAIRTADELLLLLAQDHLSRHPGGRVVFTVSNSGVLRSQVEAWGGIPVLCRVGHSFVEHAMQEHAALLGGEQSGHFFCAENYYSYDDALVAALRLLQIIRVSGGQLSGLCAAFPRVYQMPERRPQVSDDEKGKIIEQVIDHFSTQYDVNTLDGARIEFGDGAWAGIRQSNTSPCISICLEARSPEDLTRIEALVFSYLNTLPGIDWEK